jgi:aryl-alcohol dehydrogenase-like predicted oxidoreductase
MEQRRIDRLGRAVGVIGLGTWQLGADWGEVGADDARATLDAAIEAEITFFDTADVYGDGRSEQFCAELRSRHPGADVLVATKMGRRVEQVAANYNGDNFEAWNERSRANLGVAEIDLVQLHCPPTEVYFDDAVFDALEEMVAAGRMRAYGVSVETSAQALAAIARPNLATVQIILN